MKDKTLVKLAFSSSMIGVIMLFIISLCIAIPERSIANLSSSDISKTIRINGKVTDVQDSDKTAKITVEQPVYIDAVIFKQDSQAISFQKGQQLSLVGEYREVKGKKELVIDETKIKLNLNNNEKQSNKTTK